MKNMKNCLILIMGLIILLFILLKGCNSKDILDVKPNTIVVEKHDTVWVKDTLYSFKSIIDPKWDTIYKETDTSINISDLQYTRIYSDSLDDSNITIYSNQKILGLIKESKTSYKLKVPLIINNTKETTITNVETKEPSFSLNTGLELAGNKASFNLSPFIGITVRRSTIKVGYGLLDNTIQLGVGYRLFKSKK